MPVQAGLMIPQQGKEGKLCGCNEPCFEKGRCWGHFESVMCSHLGEKHENDKCVSVCFETEEKVKVYSTEKEYNKLIKDMGGEEDPK